MGLELDPFEDNPHGHVTNKYKLCLQTVVELVYEILFQYKWFKKFLFTLAVARGGGNFNPKAKIRPRNETSTSLPSASSNATEEKPVTLSSTSLETEQYTQACCRK